MQAQLKKEVGSFGLLFMSFTAMFGSGWLFAPFFAAQTAGAGSLLAWIIGAIMSMVIGLTMSEVIVMFQKAGGVNTVAQITHGKMLGFLVNIIALMVYILLPALEVRAIIQYLSSQSEIFITLDNKVTFIGYLFAAALLLIINLINIYGVKLTSRINSFSVIFKLIAPFVICLFFLFALHKNGNLNQHNLQHFVLNWNEIFLAISTSGIIFSYNGFNQATLFAAEAKNPQKSIPFAILGSIIFTAILYVFIQYVFLIAVPTAAIENGWNTLKYAGDSGPFCGLAALLGIHWLLNFIYADAIVSPLGSAFSYSSCVPRMLYAAAENSDRFPLLRKLNHNGIPTNSVIISILLSFAAFILLPNLKAMISTLVAAFVINYTVAPVSLLTLRKSSPNVPRQFKIPAAPLFCFLSIFFSEIMVLSCGYNSIRNLTVIIALAYVIGLIILMNCNVRSATRLAIKTSAWFAIQILALTVIAYLTDIKAMTFVQALATLAITSALLTFYAATSEVTNAVSDAVINRATDIYLQEQKQTQEC